MIRLILLCAALAAIAPATTTSARAASRDADAPAVRADAASMQEHVRTCRHYDGRARFKPRGPGAPLETRLADQCAAALAILRQGPAVRPARALRARLYLDRLTGLKATIIDINRDRIYGPDPARGARPSAGFGGSIGRGAQVTPTGEYLIARHMGVLDALEAWSAGEAMVKASAAGSNAGSAAQPVQPAEQPDG